MITPEQNKEIISFLFSKNLSLDLLVEIEDHFKEQILSKIDDGKPFEEAFAETKLMWKEDLLLQKRIFIGRIPKIESDSLKQINREKHLETLKFFLPYFIAVMVFAYINPEVSNYLILSANVLVGSWCAFLTIKSFRMIQSGSKYYEKRRISLLQRKMIFVSLGMQALFFNVLIYENQFEKFITAIYLFPAVGIHIIGLLMPFVYVYGGILGILCYSDYKKAIKLLQQKINLKL